VPILAASARAPPEDVAAGLGAGMDGHVAKSPELQMLSSAIVQALNRTRVAA
jgi:CheY-like chemotaxis protein